MTAQQHIPSPSSVLLERIFRELDARLTELQAARDAIASLTPQPAPKAPDPEVLPEHSTPHAEPETETQIAAQPPRRRGRPKGSRNHHPSVARIVRAPEPRALANSIPNGPVVVSPAQLAQRREVALALQAISKPRPPGEGTLESLIREMEGRRAAA